MLLAALTGYPARPLVEGGQPGAQVGREALLAGHLLQASRYLPQGLRPAGGGVRLQGDVVSHIPVILGQGDAGVDRGLPGGHRHVGGIGDEYGTGHEGLPGVRIDQLGEFQQHIGHLVAALTASDEDHYLRVRPLGYGVLQDGLPRAEGAGNTGRSSLGYREEGVDDAGPGYQWYGG